MAGDPTSTFPYNSVVLIESPDPRKAGYFLQGSGVVIGPHTILTASHVVYNVSEQTPEQNIVLYPGWSGGDPELGPGHISTTYTDHFNDIGVLGSDSLTQAQSALDYAVIDTSYTFSSWMGVVLDYSGGEVHMTGYPAIAEGVQTDQVGTVSADPNYSVLDYGTLSPSPGNSGGPVWLDYDGSDDVAGLVSTTGWASQLTAADWSQIESWVSRDGYSLGTSSHYVAAASTSGNTTPAPTGAVGADASDILWRNSDGDVALWNANGSGGFTFQDLGVVGSDWRIEGAGDFNGAAPNGILWRNSDGDVALWNSNGSGGFAFQDLGVVGADWRIEGAGDFNGKGADGILWRNANGDVALWNANGSGGFTDQDLGIVGSGWQIEGTGDFNGKGEDGVLWRNANGDVALWNANGSGGFTYQDLGVVGTSWQIAGTGDFTGTGESSILWRNADGGTELWNPNGSGGFAGQDLGLVASSWQIEGSGDFNGAGRDGVLWRNANGDTALWNANGAGGFAYQDLGVVPSSWTIAHA